MERGEFFDASLSMKNTCFSSGLGIRSLASRSPLANAIGIFFKATGSPQNEILWGESHVLEKYEFYCIKQYTTFVI